MVWSLNQVKEGLVTNKKAQPREELGSLPIFGSSAFEGDRSVVLALRLGDHLQRVMA